MIKKLLIQSAIFILIFIALTYYQNRDLLPAKTEQEIPEFSLTTLQGQWFTEQQLQDKPSVIYFFAPWCKVCHLSIGNLQSLYEDYGQDIHIIAIALDYQSHEQVQEFTQNKALTFPVLLGHRQTAIDYKISAFPTYYVLNSQRKVIARSLGYSSEIGLKLRSFFAQ